jgi:acyl dehydratase
VTPITIEQLLAGIGHETGTSPWRAVTQAMIDTFADATDDKTVKTAWDFARLAGPIG